MATKVTMTVDLDLSEAQRKSLKDLPEVVVQTAKLQGAKVKVSMSEKKD